MFSLIKSASQRKERILRTSRKRRTLRRERMLHDDHTGLCPETTVGEKRKRCPPARLGEATDVNEAANVGGHSIATPTRHRRPQAASKKTEQTRMCPHGRRRYACKECGGGAFCAEHGVVRNRCKVCALVSGIFGLRDETCLDFGALMGLD